MFNLAVNGLERKNCLDKALQLIQEDILKDENLCIKAFLIHEEKYGKDIYGEELHQFKISEIPVETERYTCYLPELFSQVYPANCKKKFNFKERIRILFKGC